MRQIWRIMRHGWRITGKCAERTTPTADLKRDQTLASLKWKDLRSLGGLDFHRLLIAGAGFEPATFGL